MLASLLELPADVDPFGLEETRMRASTLLCKVLLLTIFICVLLNELNVRVGDILVSV